MFKHTRSKTLTITLLIFLALGMFPATSALAQDGPGSHRPVVSPSGDPAALIYGGVRFRSFASNVATQEVFQGTDLNPPSPGGTLVTQNLTWIRPGTNQVTFSYDAIAHTLTSVVNNNPAPVFNNFAPTGPVNYMRIVVVERDSTSTVNFSNVTLDGRPLGSFTTNTPDPQAGCFTLVVGQPANSWCSWRVTGYDVTQGFALTGNVDLNGDFGSTDPEASKVEIVVGYLDDSFVTGQGRVTSPAGAYQPNPNLAGRARIDVTARRSNDGASVRGKAQFALQAGPGGGMDFRSSALQWLIVDPSLTTAQVSGVGTINGQNAPNGQPYNFTIWVDDGSPDTYRLKVIYYLAGVEQLVYDGGTLNVENGNFEIHIR